MVNNMRLIDVTKFIEENPVLPSSVLVALSKAPTIDAVPVVRCAECKHRGNVIDNNWCDIWFVVVKPTDFCSYGKPKEKPPETEGKG